MNSPSLTLLCTLNSCTTLLSTDSAHASLRQSSSGAPPGYKHDTTYFSCTAAELVQSTNGHFLSPRSVLWDVVLSVPYMTGPCVFNSQTMTLKVPRQHQYPSHLFLRKVWHDDFSGPHYAAQEPFLRRIKEFTYTYTKKSTWMYLHILDKYWHEHLNVCMYVVSRQKNMHKLHIRVW